MDTSFVRGNVTILGNQIYIHKGREAANLGNRLSPLSLVSNSDHLGAQRMGEDPSEAKELTKYLHPVKLV